MLWKCKNDTKSIDPKVLETSNRKTILFSKFVVCNIKKSNFIKEQEASGLLRKLGIKTPLRKTPI